VITELLRANEAQLTKAPVIVLPVTITVCLPMKPPEE